jgi:hypothetical protein
MRRFLSPSLCIAVMAALASCACASAGAPAQPVQVILKLHARPVDEAALRRLQSASGCTLSLVRPMALGAAVVQAAPAACLPRLRIARSEVRGRRPCRQIA